MKMGPGNEKVRETKGRFPVLKGLDSERWTELQASRMTVSEMSASVRTCFHHDSRTGLVMFVVTMSPTR